MKHRKRDALGNTIEKEHISPITDFRIYELELQDGRVDEYTVNIIIENLIDKIDDQVQDTVILEELVSFYRVPDVAIPIADQAHKNSNGIQRLVVTTKGWDVQVK